MKVGDKVKNEFGIGILVGIYADGRCCKVAYPHDSKEPYSWSPLSGLEPSTDEEYQLMLQERIVHRAKEEQAIKERELIAALKREEAEKERIRNESLRKEREAQRNELFTELRRWLKSDFLDVDLFYREFCSKLISQREFEQEKIAFVKSWLAENTPNKNLPDDEQIAAITAVHGHIQVIARAGSGKTTTLVNRTLFLLKHCGVDASEMLLLAFNRKAASEIRRRLLVFLNANAEEELATEIRHRKNDNKKIDFNQIESQAVDAVATKLNIKLPHIMTFHALAYAIVHPEESILYDGAEGESQGLSRVFQQVIDDHLQIPYFKDKVREMMLAHFKNDWEKIVSGGYDLNKEEFLKFRRSLRQQSLNGDYIKSFGEKVIADFLFEHNVTYKYEKNYWWSDINYRPDFTLFLTEKTGVIIEYFGLQSDIDYDAMTQEKRDFWFKEKGWKLIERYPHDITTDGQEKFLSRLKVDLQAHGFPCERLSEEEIWQRIKDRAIDQFTKAMVNFIGKCRRFSYSVDDLQGLIDYYEPLYDSETMFHNLALTLYDAYLNRLKATGEEDFNGLMQRAVDLINTGKVSFERKSGNGKLTDLRYLCIDEFQDFSDQFYQLLSAIRAKNTTVELFCVGDDWQAINGFAGSDLRFFQNFTDHIGKSTQLYISTNYRSSKAIVTVGNKLMSGLGKPAVAHKNEQGEVILVDLEKFTSVVSLIEKERHGRYNKFTPMILRIVNKALVDGLDVVILCRNNTLQTGGKISDFLTSIQSFFPKELHKKITISTAHTYKGREKSVVIIPDALDRSYPLIHPNWIFSRIFGDSPETITKEEQRLFYVALTRAINKLVIITESRQISPFLLGLQIAEIDWLEYPPVSTEIKRLVVKIGNQKGRYPFPTISIKHLLIASSYQWNSQSQTWQKSFSIESFSVETIKSEIWATSADGIEVHIVNDADEFVESYLINGGNWHSTSYG